MLLRWRNVGEAVSLSVRAGPLVRPSQAQAAVTRVREAAKWAWSRTDIDSDPPLVVDRHGAVKALAADLDAAVPPPKSPLTFFSAFRRWVPLSASLQSSFWRAGEDKPLLLVAPNIWVRGRDRNFDQNDYARLTALRTAKWSALLGRYVWLKPALLREIAALSTGQENLARMLLLLDQVVEHELADLTPRTIPSINWLRRHHGPLAAHSIGGRTHEVRSHLHEQQVEVVRFVQESRLFERGGADLLLKSASSFPTRADLRDPELWLQRTLDAEG